MERLWKKRDYSLGDEHKLIRLFTATWGKWHTLEYWRWKYCQNPQGFLEKLIWVAEEKDLVGHYAIIGAKLKLGDTCVLGAQSVDTATHPNHRRRGIFKDLAITVYEHASQIGIHMVYGFAAGASLRGFIKRLGWKVACPVPVLVYPLNFKKVAALKSPNRLLRRLTVLWLKIEAKLRRRDRAISKVSEGRVMRISSFDERFDLFWEDIKHEYHNIVVRDKDYLNWRYTLEPEHEYAIFAVHKGGKILGFTVVGISEGQNMRIGNILEALCLSGHDEEFLRLIETGISWLKQRHADIVRCWMPDWHRYWRLLRKYGFRRYKTDLTLIVRSVMSGSLSKTLFQRTLWFFTLGDSDHA